VVSINNRWKLDSSCKAEDYIIISGNPIKELEKAINEGKIEFTDENYHWVEEKILEKDEFLNEKEARDNLLQTILLYARTCKRFVEINKIEENYYFVLHETLKKVVDELNVVVNKIFAFERNGKRLTKGKGESMEHYLMRGIILQHLDEKFGVKDFHEEYSKLKEVLRKFLKGEGNEKEWKKIAERADLYVILRDGTKLWIEVERTANSSELNKKLKRIKTVLSYFPELIDKVVFIFSGILGGAMEGTLVEAKTIGFPVEKLEFYEINLREARLMHAIRPKLVKTEFEDRILDGIADGTMKLTGKTAMMAKDRIRKRIIMPLINNKFERKWVNEKQDKIKRLIHFWRIRVGKCTARTNEIKSKENALKKIKSDYSFLLT
jgi:hypothetical protein